MFFSSPTRRDFIGASLVGFTLPAFSARAEVVRLVLPFTPGSGTDAAARILAEGLTSAAGRSVIVENRPGGNTVIGTNEVARALPNGGTLLMTTGGHTTNGVLMKKLPYDPLTSFTPITMLSRGIGWVLVVGANSPYANLQQFLEAARQAPKKINYGSSGIGNGTHVMAEIFARSAGIEMTHVPYKGTPITDLVAGSIDCSFQGVSTVNAMVRTGRLRALAVSSEQRLSALPGVPTFKEFGVDAHLPSWLGVFAPAKLPQEEIEALYLDLKKAVQVKSFQEMTAQSAGEVVAMPPREFLTYLTQEVENYRRILPSLKIEME